MKLSIAEFYLSKNPRSTPEHRNKYLGTIFLFQKEGENNTAADRIKKERVFNKMTNLIILLIL